MKTPKNEAAFRVELILLGIGLWVIFTGVGERHAMAQPIEAGSGWISTGSLNTQRSGHTATLLLSGKVLVAGGRNSAIPLDSTELYDPTTGSWNYTGKLNMARSSHTATLLPNGKVLVAGGDTTTAPPSFGITNSAEVYDPDTGTWSTTGSLIGETSGHTATLLPNGKVLVAGGWGGNSALYKAELYDPTTGTWSVTGSLIMARYWHTATPLKNGMVLVVGGSDDGDLFSTLSRAELYNPETGTWSLAATVPGRVFHTATVLPSGKVLVVGGYNPTSSLDDARLYDPDTGTWSKTGNLNAARDSHTATLLPGGGVLVVGGRYWNRPPQDSTELYFGNWNSSFRINTARYSHTGTLLLDGKVLVAGGSGSSEALSSAELYVPPASSTFFVPVVLSAGGFGGSFFTSELILANRSANDVTVEFDYTAAFGGGTGQAADTLEAGKQRIASDAIAYLRQLGIPIPESGSHGGTLRVRVSGLASPSEGAVIVRTTTAVPEGRAGLAYPAVPLDTLLEGTAYLCGLRQDASNRSNVALQNAGDTQDGDISLRLRVFSGNPDAPFFQDLPEIVLPPGGFHQINEVLRSNGLSLPSGYVRVERISGSAPYYAYAIINNQTSSDGSFIPPVVESPHSTSVHLTLPVLPGPDDRFKNELVLTNFSGTDQKVALSFQAVEQETFPFKGEITLKAGEQMILSDEAAWLRDFGFGLYQRPFAGVMGPLVATVDGDDASQIFLGMRVLAVGTGGQYGLFFPAIPEAREARSATWLFGLKQNAESRSNLAVVNLGTQPILFTIELFDGEMGIPAGTVQNLTVNPQDWLQLNSVLAVHASGVTQGYARVIPAGSHPFVAYAVVNDGAHPGERSGDGSLIESAP